ncbi:MAG: 23S rRNA (guanosine(2251)-2'-O)-methyltransferase RlmB [Clostridiales bacterium]|nr:MAG: 23S rRNA (guanosine(2251)-2'-O)-methyltransferase RlmB [Clostridiales bacterium]
MIKKNIKTEKATDENIVCGRNPIIELISSDRTVDKIFVRRGQREGSILKILAMAKDYRITVVEADKAKLDAMSGGANHQGVVALATDFVYCDVEDIIDVAQARNEKPFILIIDGITDPHNLGALIRTAHAVGVHGIILPKRNACGLTTTVYKAAAGSCEHIKIARVVNIAETISYIKQKNIWVYGADGKAENNIYKTDFTGASALVLGDEGRGVSRLVRDRCDALVKIPMREDANSLNVSVAGGVLMYEILRQRG